MASAGSGAKLSSTRAWMVARFARQFASMGAPVDRLLARAAIPPEVLQFPEAAVPLENAYRFGESACRAIGSEHAGLEVGISTALENLGAYEGLLKRCLTPVCSTGTAPRGRS